MSTNKEELETAPDPEEDDLDDLDDVLDEFAVKPKPSATSASAASTAAQPTASGPGRPATATTVEDAPDLPASAAGEAPDLDPSDLQAGMANLISQLGEDKDMQKQFEAMMQELIAAGAAGTDAEAATHVSAAADAAPTSEDGGSGAATATAAKGSAAAGGKKDADSFQDTIRKTMERMQQSGDAATAASASSGAGAGAGAGGLGGMSEDELLAQMMRELGAGGGEGGGGGEDFNQMLLSMMTQLTNKEILYEPMKELDDKFPDWLQKNGGTVAADEKERYEEQSRLVREIVARFERSGYSDDNEEDREYIVERMQKMQAAGSPPPDLVGDMGAAQEALGELDAGCPTQ